MLSVIVPVYNEAGTIASVLNRLLEIDFGTSREILVVNDGSTDGTAAALQAFGRHEPAMRIINAPRNQGKGAAIRLGLQHARGKAIAIQDADLELDPAQLPALIAPVINGQTPVVYGSRFLAGRPPAPWLSLLANRTLTAITNLMYGSSLTDMETCYKVMRTDVARDLKLAANGFEIEPEITAKLLRRGHTILELPVVFKPRSKAEGKKMRWRDGLKALRELSRQRFARVDR
jgi:glycosyltransferase involved in cell wall biosynthesis